jgi:chloramphenicol-sensitive protein RarD
VPSSISSRSTSGILCALGAFFLWGVLPLFWKMFHDLPAASIIAHRTIWSLCFLWLVLLFQKNAKSTLAQLKQPRIALWHLLSGLLLAGNWLLYVWATLHERILEGALGYYLNPFFNMLFGYFLFGERHSSLQKISIAIALTGVAFQFHGVHGFPWIAITLALSFSLYAVVRKKSPLPSLQGLSLETLLLAPIALAWLLCAHPSLSETLQHNSTQSVLLIATGVATATPLLLFGYAARNMSLTTLGVLQFLGPTLQFLIGWKVYHEPLSRERIISFAFIWTAIALYAWSCCTPKEKSSSSKQG